MTCKFTFVLATLLFFTIKAHSQANKCYFNDFKDDPRVTFVWADKCKRYSSTYVCKGGFKPDVTLISQWNKDPKFENVYEFSQKFSTEKTSKDFKEETLDLLLEKSCSTGCFANEDVGWSAHELETCTKPGEQQIFFNIEWPDGNSSRGTWIYCNAAGGTALLNKVYPKAAWKELPRMPHYYKYKAKTDGEADVLLNLVHDARTKTEGCHL